MHKNQNFDAVDQILEQWKKEKPQLELESMAIIGRLKRCAALIQPQLDNLYAEFELSFWEFDVLATLLRSGGNYCLTPTELFSSLMITSGTMTHRMTQLEKKGWIVRVNNEQDARSKLVQLSSEGFNLINQAIEKHVENENRILKPLNDQQKKQLNNSLKALLNLLEVNT